MGGKTKSEVKTMIKNELSTEINNKTKNISTLVNNSVTNIMQSIKQSAEAEVTATTNILNTSNISGLVLRGPGSKITLNQDAVAKIENTAIIKIISDAAELQKMGNNIADNIKSNLQNNQGAKQDLESLSKIGEFSKKNGGPEGMLDTLAQTVGGMVTSLTGGSTSSVNDTQIINAIKTTINNETINENNINNSISTSISSMMEQMAKAKCNFNTDGKNELNISNAEVTDGAVYTQSQSLNLANFNNCIIDLNLGSKISNDLTNGFKTDISNAQTNDQSSDQKAKTTNDITKITLEESSIMNSVDNLIKTAGSLASAPMYIIGGIILLVVGVPIILSFAGGSSRNRDDYGGDGGYGGDGDDGGDRGRGRGRGRGNSGDLDELEGGGVKGNIYLLATFVAMIILIARKSLPLCVVLLVIIILYFVHKKNPELLGLQDTK